MPKGPKVEKRPADVIGAAVKVMKVATGEIEEDTDAGGVSRPALAGLFLWLGGQVQAYPVW